MSERGHGSVAAMSRRGNARRVVTTSLALLALAASLLLLVNRLGGLTSSAVQRGFAGDQVVRLVAVFPLYLVAAGLVHVGWGVLADRAYAGDHAIFGRACAVSCRSQVGKYLPGNVGHLAGRQLMTARLGWPHSVAASASIAETIAVPSTALLVVIAGSPFADVTALTRISVSKSDAIPAVVLVGVVAFGALLVSRMPRLVPLRRRLLALRGSWRPVLACYLGFVVLGGLAQALLIPEAPVIDVVVASTIAWVAGYLTPGVPAGIGVREAVLVLLVDLDAEVIAGGVIGFRLVMVLADLTLFAGGSVLERLAWRAVPTPVRADVG
jgi:hypothetical protein